MTINSEDFKHRVTAIDLSRILDKVINSSISKTSEIKISSNILSENMTHVNVGSHSRYREAYILGVSIEN